MELNIRICSVSDANSTVTAPLQTLPPGTHESSAGCTSLATFDVALLFPSNQSGGMKCLFSLSHKNTLF